MAIERHADREATFVTLRDKGKELLRNTRLTQWRTSSKVLVVVLPRVQVLKVNVCKISEAHPVTENPRASVCCPNVSDEGDVLQFGEDKQQQTLHSDGCHLTHKKINTKPVQKKKDT